MVHGKFYCQFLSMVGAEEAVVVSRDWEHFADSLEEGDGESFPEDDRDQLVHDHDEE